MATHGKSAPADLAIFGGPALFDTPRSTSSLVQPDFDRFMGYSRASFEAGQYTNNGPCVRLLEERLAAFHQADHAIAFCSGFWALVLTIRAVALPGRGEIVMPSLTYRRMADIAAWVGLRPRFCDVDPDRLTLTPDTIAPCLGDETALIMAVHPIVNCCDAGAIERLAREAGVPVVFDAVESVYETLPEGRIGRFGAAECFSLHASKLLNGFEGGYVTTSDGDLAAQLRSMRTFGFTGQDDVSVPDGLNAKLCEVHAAMALANLDKLDEVAAENKARYRAYQREMPGLPGLRLLEFDESRQCSFKNIVMEVGDSWPVSRDELVRLLNAERVLARAHYAPALHQKPMAYPHIPARLPTTERLVQRFVNMPCGDFVTTEDIERTCALLRFVAEHGQAIRAAFDREKEAAVSHAS